MERNINDCYVFGSELGRGAYSVVREATLKGTNKMVAIKCIRRKYVRSHLLQREIEIMKKVNHPNILALLDVFEDNEFIYLVLELVKGGDLFSKVVDDGYFKENEAQRIMKTILKAVEYCHQLGIAHRDLKPENVLCSTEKEFNIFIGDFGFSKIFEDEGMETQCGSLEYTAPEVLTGKKYDQACDLWSIGVITFVILSGCFPFFSPDGDTSTLYDRIQKVNYNWNDMPPNVSEKARNFISKLLLKDASMRMTAQEALRHPWFAEKTLNKEIVDKKEHMIDKEQIKEVIVKEPANPVSLTTLFVEEIPPKKEIDFTHLKASTTDVVKEDNITPKKENEKKVSTFQRVLLRIFGVKKS